MGNPDVKSRCDDLYALEMKADMAERHFIGANEYNKDFNVGFVELQCETDEDWNKIVSDLKKELELRKKGLSPLPK